MKCDLGKPLSAGFLAMCWVMLQKCFCTERDHIVQGHLDAGSVRPEQRTPGGVPSKAEVGWTGVGSKQCLGCFLDVKQRRGDDNLHSG